MMFNSKSLTILKLQKQIDRIIQVLEPREFVNCHMVSYFCDDLWNKFIPENIRNEINCKEDVDTAIEVFLHQDNAKTELLHKHRNLYNYINFMKSFYLENLEDKFFHTTDELLEKFHHLNIPFSSGLNLSIREFMKEKKNHEVEIISRIIAALVKARDRNHFIVDVGDGKGYLSSRLNLEFKLKVLGIDGNQQNTKEAEKRNQKLSKKWKALVSKEALKNNIENVIVDTEMSNERYKTASSMIFAQTNLNELVNEKFPEEATNNICLVGLHTCGNLAASSLKQFVKNDSIKLLCNVGCCYHLIFEEFEDDFFDDEVRVMDKRDEPAFPMSNYLQMKQYKLGRNARMLGSQSLDRVIAKKELPDESLFYRALFEKLVKEKWFVGERKSIKLGKIRHKNFEDYLKKGCKKFNIELNMTSEEIEKLAEDHEYDRRLINLNYFIRLLLSKIVETLILLDRYLYLLESDTDKVFLVKIFDPVISPRNHAIIAIKK